MLTLTTVPHSVPHRSVFKTPFLLRIVIAPNYRSENGIFLPTFKTGPQADCSLQQSALTVIAALRGLIHPMPLGHITPAGRLNVALRSVVEATLKEQLCKPPITSH